MTAAEQRVLDFMNEHGSTPIGDLKRAVGAEADDAIEALTRRGMVWIDEQKAGGKVWARVVRLR